MDQPYEPTQSPATGETEPIPAPEPVAESLGETGTFPDLAEEQGGGRGSQMLAQLQSMIDDITHQARPVLREVAAKAAELAAIAGEKAGPIAHKAAEVTEEVGGKVAARGKELAAELRREGNGQHPGSAEGGDAPTEPLAESSVEHRGEALGE
ncbi:MAG TPA: hypothetical protein VF763_14970 [Candidatus Limnocylindrales bacterium]